MACSTSWRIIEAFHGALCADASLNQWARDAYAQELTVLKGINFYQPPRESDCPLIALLPERAVFGRVAEHESIIRMVLAVADKRFDHGELVGLRELAQHFGTLAMHALQAAEEHWYIGKVTDLYELEDFPLLYREFSITVTGTTCIGGNEL